MSTARVPSTNGATIPSYAPGPGGPGRPRGWRRVVAGPRHSETDTVVLHSAEEDLNAATVRL